MLDYIDSLVHKITMYRLVLYYLIALILAAVGLSLAGSLHYKPIYLVISTSILVASCWLINKILGYFFDAPINTESSLITGLILALIITPNPTGILILYPIAASGLAMASKYILAINKKHIFNPAAIAVVLTALGPRQDASWWVGSSVMLPFVLIGGVLVMRKIQQTKMVTSFFVFALLATIVGALITKTNVSSSVHILLLSSPLFFLGFVMLTEPATSPTKPSNQICYAAIVAFLLPPQIHLFSVYSSPEISLSIGNVFSYLVNPKIKLFPVFKEKMQIAKNSLDFILHTDQKLAYQPGQYMEWTMPHTNTDSRGDRRYFTLASSPTEPDLRIGVKFYKNGSSFKKALLNIDRNTLLSASQISGEFTLPKDPSKKLVFIAGGIGITPFRSMVKYLSDRNKPRSMTLLYSVRTRDDIAYGEVFEEAKRVGLKTIYKITDEKIDHPSELYQTGKITADFIKQVVPDYTNRLFYISGTFSMVSAMKADLISLGVARHNIKIDFFPGYA